MCACGFVGQALLNRGHQVEREGAGGVGWRGGGVREGRTEGAKESEERNRAEEREGVSLSVRGAPAACLHLRVL